MARPGLQRLGKSALKIAIAVVVLGMVGRHVVRTWQDLRRQGGSLHIDGLWVGLAAVLYLSGLVLCGIYFGRVMDAGPTPVSRLAAVRAYVISHLGKYVPGKAMVVVMRVGLLVPYGARPATTAFAALYETLVMMAAGGLAAALGFALIEPQWLPAALGLALGLGLLAVVEPRLFPRIGAVIRLPFPRVGAEAVPTVSHRLLVEGLAWTLAAWTLLGLSLVAVVHSLTPVGIPVERWPTMIAGVALATVTGFAVAVLPGGLGVREGVLMTTMAPALGTNMAVVSALALRLVWVLAELLAAGILSLWRLPLRRPTSP
jgi:uncharacterized membrane protein YbhN (UPF0104 family)